jgi:5-oxoprolinase (ATP-hydrolysing)
VTVITPVFVAGKAALLAGLARAPCRYRRSHARLSPARQQTIEEEGVVIDLFPLVEVRHAARSRNARAAGLGPLALPKPPRTWPTSRRRSPPTKPGDRSFSASWRCMGLDVVEAYMGHVQ